MSEKSIHVNKKYPKIEVHFINHNQSGSLIASTDINANEPIALFEGEILKEATKFTLQVNETSHILCDDGPKYTNHSCEPNAYFLFPQDSSVFPTLTAICDIKKGDEITFDYATTEWLMSESFNCACNKKSCVLFVDGFFHLVESRKVGLLNYLSPYIKECHKKMNL